MASFLDRRSCMGSVAMIFVLVGIYAVELSHSTAVIQGEGHAIMVIPKANTTVFARKLMQSDDDGGDMNRIGNACSKDDIVITQGPIDPLSNGIPAFEVEIVNENSSGCEISNIHVSCGWFSSAKLVNPEVFRRVYYDDCLVNNGGALAPGQSLSFEYANTFNYSLSVSSVNCC